VEDKGATFDGNSVGCIGHMSSDGSIAIISIEEKNRENKGTDLIEISNFPSEIINSIINGIAVAATNASMVENKLATHWIILTKGNKVEKEGKIKTNTWQEELIPAGEGFGLLDLVVTIVKQTKYMQQGEIIVYNNNKKIHEIEKEITKESECTQEAGAVVEAIKRQIKKSKVMIKIEYSNDKPYPNENFAQKPGPILMRRCDEEAKRKCLELTEHRYESSVEHVGIVTPKIGNKFIDKNINVLIREIDTKQQEIEATKERAGDK